MGWLCGVGVFGLIECSHSLCALHSRLQLIIIIIIIIIITPLFLPSSSVSLSYFVLAVPMRECLGKHSCMSSPFPTAILNGTCFFLTVQLQVLNVYSERKTRNNCAVVNHAFKLNITSFHIISSSAAVLFCLKLFLCLLSFLLFTCASVGDDHA